MDSHNHKKTPIRIAFGSNIRTRRLSLRMSQGKLAESTGLHINYIGSVERGERNLGLENIYTLAHALNCKAKDLVSDEELQLEINPKANSQNSDSRFDNLQFQVDILMDLIKELKNDAINPI